jgi:hypothetical protein
MDDDPIANERIADHRIRTDRAITPDPDPGADHGICSNCGSSTDFNLRADHGARLDGNPVFHARACVDVRPGEIARLRQR